MFSKDQYGLHSDLFPGFGRFECPHPHHRQRGDHWVWGLSIFTRKGLSWEEVSFIKWWDDHLIHDDLQPKINLLYLLIISIFYFHLVDIVVFAGSLVLFPPLEWVPNRETGCEHLWGDSCQCQLTGWWVTFLFMPCGHTLAAIAPGSLSLPCLACLGVVEEFGHVKLLFSDFQYNCLI